MRDRGQNGTSCTHIWVEADARGDLACCDCDRLIYDTNRTATW